MSSQQPDSAADGAARAVLAFWFEETPRERWFRPDPAFDEAIRARFGALVEEGLAGRLGDWAETAAGALALVLLLDQFPRNMFRGQARAFAGDPLARSVAQAAIARGFDLAVAVERRVFFYLPLEHCEGLAEQQRCLELIRERIGDPQYIDYAERHLQIIVRFGRFPHRNAILGRPSTAEERAFLEQPGSGF